MILFSLSIKDIKLSRMKGINRSLSSIESSVDLTIKHSLDPKLVVNLSKLRNITLICGRYEGIDQRIIDKYVDEEISLGDFILSGGEYAAICLIDAISRCIPGT
jgi:tRNA (guanine-N1)-methyltransferase